MGYQGTLLRLTVAALLGGVIGLERHRSDKAAGMRTHMMVCLGSALVMIVSAYGFDQVLRPARVVLDPSRVAAQVVSGIGFLGAGIILRRNEAVLGLTTAASIWAVAAVGLAAGGGLYLAAAAATAIILAILIAMKPIEDRILVREGRRNVSLLVEQGVVASKAIEVALQQAGVELLGLRIRRGDEPSERRVDVTISRANDERLLGLMGRLQAAEGVLEVRYEGHPS
ncbi:MAG: MgtC/SapB family protein [Planctomycetaceae bacterium]|nr:MgtC/SapB family protein [Planctomycetaceae bacterium]MBV8610593.1 MgtC/SapB family protein [Singulisphaera sp.]MBV8232722.1 MgtC/SapB family protein [Planctomycetaceae bacterium]MBV8266320.1 MgtC/SapB family protein [Planctomycetaceae bacterium]MBV8313489.1 MgtC/SapB family protein [Planctomycetaceae bacterium]